MSLKFRQNARTATRTSFGPGAGTEIVRCSSTVAGSPWAVATHALASTASLGSGIVRSSSGPAPRARPVRAHGGTAAWHTVETTWRAILHGIECHLSGHLIDQAVATARRRSTPWRSGPIERSFADTRVVFTVKFRVAAHDSVVAGGSGSSPRALPPTVLSGQLEDVPVQPPGVAPRR